MREIVDRKFANLDAYLEKYPMESFILGLSGGVDSAVVAKLLNLYNKERKYKYKIYLVSIMYADGVGGEAKNLQSNQDAIENTVIGLRRPLEQKNTFFNSYWLPSYPTPFDASDSELPISIFTDEGYPKTWLIGQFNANLRSVYFYHFANAYNGLVCGTINKSEYLTGYWGKFCDAQVDIQLLFDLYKTEVYELAKYLGVPDFIIKRTPTGDTYNNKTDEDILGANWFEIDKFLMQHKLTPAQLFKDMQNLYLTSDKERTLHLSDFFLPLYRLYPNQKFWNHVEKNLFKFEYTPQGIFI